MKKSELIILVLWLAVSLFGCAKKQEPLEQMQEPMSMEGLSTLDNETQIMPEPKPQVAPQPAQTSAPSELLPPPGPYKPTTQEIQTALKNAGYYTGGIDGKIGPLTKKATEEFQKANNLKADGKVGPKTWDVLSKYLNQAPAPITPAKSTKKR